MEGFTGVDPGIFQKGLKQGSGHVCRSLGYRDKPPVEGLGGFVPIERSIPAEAKCEINVQLLTFSCRKCRI